MSVKFDRISIIGVGLIGGSLGLAIKSKELASKVIGIGRRQSSLEKAKNRDEVDEITLDLKEGVKEADVVIVAAPIDKVIDISKEALKYMSEGSIITDVASTKSIISRQIEQVVPGGIYYVGSHPIAGSEKRGPEFAESNLFDNTNCIITSTEKTNPKALSKVKDLWDALGTRVTIMSPEEHDEIIAITSHIPHLLATGLIDTASPYLNATGGSFKDITRVALSSPRMWTSIFLQNKEHVINAAEKLVEDLEKMLDIVKKEDSEKLLGILENVNQIRKKLK